MDDVHGYLVDLKHDTILLTLGHSHDHLSLPFTWAQFHTTREKVMVSIFYLFLLSRVALSLSETLFHSIASREK